MDIRYHGHSCVELIGENYSLIIDPFITDNPHTKITAKEVKVDFIYVTHGHGDHLGDTIEIARHNDALVIAPYELAIHLSWENLHTHAVNIGGSFQFPFGRLKVMPAFHSSSIINNFTREITYTGVPSGVLIEMDGKKIYHAGDTALFSDMRLLEKEQLDIALLPIGDNFTMGIDDALIAASLIKAKKTIPIHYNTFPTTVQDPQIFVNELAKKGLAGEILSTNKAVTI
jgi:L-ascorbate metabolism protein UlaG (beta-lactamase superfamily)